MSKICPLFSGSTGNSTYISTSSGGIMIDAGASYKGLCDALCAVGVSAADLCAVAVTHEHIDHVKGLKLLLKNTGVPLIASRETLDTLISADCVPAGTELIAADDAEIALGELSLTRFATSHDCPGSSGYVITLPDGRRVAVCTDLGVVTDQVRQALCGCTSVLFESNHDIQMLNKGPYPPVLKRRILSDTGHLSNNACSAELPQLLQSGTTRFILGHLSRNNNLPMLAAAAAKASLMDIGAKENEHYILTVARPCGNEGIPI